VRQFKRIGVLEKRISFPEKVNPIRGDIDLFTCDVDIDVTFGPVDVLQAYGAS
jgi:hypothetical protein